MITRALLVLLCTAAVGCGAQERDSGARNSAPQPIMTDHKEALPQSAPPSPPPSPPATDPRSPTSGKAGGTPETETMPVERQIIRNGEITLRVPTLDSAEQAVAAIAVAHNGYASSSSRERSVGNALTGTVQIRVPADTFQSVLTAVRMLGEVQRESISSNDVTEEYIDLSARLKTQQELESRLLNLLNERGGKLSDIIEIEGKLADVRKEIESIQGRLRYLQGQVSYSTLTVTMFEPGAVGTSETETFGGRIERAFDSGVDGLIGVMGGLITVVIALLPVFAVMLVAYLILRPIWRRRRMRRTAGQKPATATDEAGPKSEPGT